MILSVCLGVVGLLCAVALLAALTARWARASLLLGSAGVVVACAVGATASALALVRECREEATTPLATPLGPLQVGIDPLSAFFLLCVFLVSGLAALYGAGYLRSDLGRRNTALASSCFALLVASMATVVLARDLVLFLGAWELMSIASFFLVTYENDRLAVRRAGVTYLVASHAGAALLFVMFILLTRATGRYDFASIAAAGVPASLDGAAFLLALVGFGAKAGFWPLHIWLPDAHPAAPSHVSAVMSGAMIKLGIYGLLRTLTILGPPPVWWGALLLGVGVVSGVLGVLHALAQHDLKRLLAYHSVENLGIIAMGIGLGLLGRSLGNPQVAFLGMAGGLLHVLNHGVFKGLLFQGAGSVLHATGLRELDHLGGLQRRMPQTALTFLVGAAAISGLPPLNGFVSEWLIYLGAFRGAGVFPTAGAIAVLFVIVALALIGGLAAACFVKAFGVAFLGEPRGEEAAEAHEAPRSMTVAMWIGAALCVSLGLGALWVVRLVSPVAAAASGAAVAPEQVVGPLGGVVTVAVVLVAVIGGLALLRRGLLRGREIGAAPTWGCGYPVPTPRMQYTAASFAEPVLRPFQVVFHRDAAAERTAVPRGLFPTESTGVAPGEHLDDRAQRSWISAASALVRLLARIGFLQRGRVQLYLAYVLATLVALLVWQALTGGQ